MTTSETGICKNRFSTPEITPVPQSLVIHIINFAFSESQFSEGNDEEIRAIYFVLLPPLAAKTEFH